MMGIIFLIVTVICITSVWALKVWVNYKKSCFHEWKHIRSIAVYSEFCNSTPESHKAVLQCKKCGDIKKVKL